MSNASSGKHRLLFVVKIFFTVIFIISFSIAVPIVARPYYYWHIDSLDIEKTTPWSYEEIKQAYDDVMDYCITGGEFSTGVLKHTSEGESHFKDCQVLFRLDLILAAVSGIALIVLRKIKNKHSAGFWGGIINICCFASLGLISAVLGFDKIFTIFHQVLFNGKDNWLFDPKKDEIIRILPEEFFMDCGILIISLIIGLSVILVIADKIKNKNLSSKRRLPDEQRGKKRENRGVMQKD